MTKFESHGFAGLSPVSGSNDSRLQVSAERIVLYSDFGECCQIHLSTSTHFPKYLHALLDNPSIDSQNRRTFRIATFVFANGNLAIVLS